MAVTDEELNAWRVNARRHALNRFQQYFNIKPTAKRLTLIEKHIRGGRAEHLADVRNRPRKVYRYTWHVDRHGRRITFVAVYDHRLDALVTVMPEQAARDKGWISRLTRGLSPARAPLGEIAGLA